MISGGLVKCLMDDAGRGLELLCCRHRGAWKWIISVPAQHLVFFSTLHLRRCQKNILRFILQKMFLVFSSTECCHGDFEILKSLIWKKRIPQQLKPCICILK